MKNNLWIIITLVVGFVGYMIGYSVPPFLEVGIGSGGHTVEGGSASNAEEELMKQYEQMYKSDDE